MFRTHIFSFFPLPAASQAAVANVNFSGEIFHTFYPIRVEKIVPSKIVKDFQSFHDTRTTRPWLPRETHLIQGWFI
jgi:hypothetical protein